MQSASPVRYTTAGGLSSPVWAFFRCWHSVSGGICLTNSTKVWMDGGLKGRQAKGGKYILASSTCKSKRETDGWVLGRAVGRDGRTDGWFAPGSWISPLLHQRFLPSHTLEAICCHLAGSGLWKAKNCFHLRNPHPTLTWSVPLLGCCVLSNSA